MEKVMWDSLLRPVCGSLHTDHCYHVDCHSEWPHCCRLDKRGANMQHVSAGGHSSQTLGLGTDVVAMTKTTNDPGAETVIS